MIVRCSRSFAAGLLFGILLARSVGAEAPATDDYQLLPDVGGPITEAAVSVASARRAALRNAELISNIVNTLPTRIDFGILTNDRAAFTVANNPWPERIRFLDVDTTRNLTIWTQDPFLVLQDGSGATRLLKPWIFERAGDEVMPAVVSDAFGIDVQQSRLFFEGGNLVSDAQHVFIGANTIRYNAVRWVASEADVVRQFELELGRTVLVIGPMPQPIGHIDMMLTPLGNGRIAVADASLGAAAVEQADADDPAQIDAFEDEIERGFFGDPAIRELRLADGRTARVPPVRGETLRMARKSREIAPLLDGIAAAISARGYEVVRIPFLFGGPDADPGSDDKNQGVARYPMLTYNNVLLESVPERVVYLPEYGLPAVDRAALNAWRDAGFRTVRVPGLTISAMYGGALRCSVKVLRRQPDPGVLRPPP